MTGVKIDYRDHTPECQVTAERVSLLGDIATIAADRSLDVTGVELDSLLGAAIEYYEGGDQEVENCTCQSQGE